MFLLENHARCWWPARFITLAAILFVFVSAANAQTPPRPGSSPPPLPSDPPATNPTKEDPLSNYGSPENEIHAKGILKEEKKRYDEHQARAREASQIASQLYQNYAARKAFNSEDAKKLERLEKLTKRIRNEAGGSESETDADVKDLPSAIEAAVKHMAELADELQKMVEKTPRNVVSAAVIDQANKLIGLVQHLRDNNR
jgi:hypothetical protein